MVVGGRGEGEAGEGAVEGGRRGVDGVEEEVAAVAGGRGEGEAGGGEVAGQGIVGGREAVEVGRRGVEWKERLLAKVRPRLLDGWQRSGLGAAPCLAWFPRVRQLSQPALVEVAM